MADETSLPPGAVVLSEDDDDRQRVWVSLESPGWVIRHEFDGVVLDETFALTVPEIIALHRAAVGPDETARINPEPSEPWTLELIKAQIDSCGYANEAGPLKNNVAYQELIAMVADLRAQLQQAVAERDRYKQDAEFQRATELMRVQHSLTIQEKARAEEREACAIFIEDTADTADPAGVQRHLRQRAAQLRSLGRNRDTKTPSASTGDATET